LLRWRAGQARRYALSGDYDVTWKPTTSEVSPQSFGEVVANHKLAVFHFWASWNMVDKKMDEALREIETEHRDHAFFGSVDTECEGHWQKCRDLGVLNLPALACFINGEHVETVIGMRSKKYLSSKVKEWLIAARA